jgi:hypothetical protein
MCLYSISQNLPLHVSLKNLELVKSNSANGIIRTPDWLTWYPMVMFHCCTMPSSLETDINAKHSPRSGQTDGRTRLRINPNSCRINLCIERRKDSFLLYLYTGILIPCLWHTVVDLVWVSLFGEWEEGGQVSFCPGAQIFKFEDNQKVK